MMHYGGGRKVSHIRTALHAIIVLHLTAASPFSAQSSNDRPLLNQSPMLCTDGAFVAMVPLARPQPLIVVTMGRNGIAPQQTASTNGNEVFGMKCGSWGVELLVRETGSDHFSRLPFSIHDDTIQREQRQDLDWSISRNGPMPREIEREMGDFHRLGWVAGSGMLGDWYVRVPNVVNLEHIYELHFVRTEKRLPHGLETTLVVNLLEETYQRKVTKSVPIISEKKIEAGD
jgi:hypothetical protein